MRGPRKVLIVFYLFLALFCDRAHTAPLYRAVLINSQEIHQLAKKYGVSIPDLESRNPALHQRLQSKSSLCASLNVGCLIPGYLDDASMVDNTYHDDLIPAPHLSLKEFSRRSGRAVHGYGTDRTKESERWREIFKKEGYFSSKKRDADQAAIVTAFQQLKSDKITAQEFERLVFQHPTGFAVLPKIYKESYTKRDRKLNAIIEPVITKALLLTMDSLHSVAGAQFSTYPYVEKWVKGPELLDVSELFKELSSQGRWPTFRSLTPETRALTGGEFEEHSNGKWKIKAVYNQRSNTVWVDLLDDFFENVYVLYHELWHVAWAHSKPNSENVDRLVKQVRDQGNKDPQALRGELLRHISENEISAIDQQNRLYHATTYLSEQWSDSSASSASGWHDSYYGSQSKMYKLLRIEKQTMGTDYWMEKCLICSGVIYPVGSIFSLTAMVARVAAKIPLDAVGYPSWIRDKHAAKFEKKYIGNELGLSKVPKLIDNYQSRLSPFLSPEPARISCDELKEIQQSLGKNWQFGIPFRYETDSQCVGEGKSLHPELEGSHPELEGSHPGLTPAGDGFPSVDGTEENGDSK